MTNPPRVRRFARSAALAAGLVSALLLGGPALAATPQAAPAAVAVAPVSAKIVGDICYSDLPSQAHDTIRLIDAGGPFPYPKDGTVFSNREGVLPKQTSGYYHEYTVKTPGSPDRGARRIVTGQKSHEDYYTGDHYETFDLVDFTC
ncbi:ribonuclease [Streptomyces albireticuli]|uniref:Ribonuclease n=2 Tax=Streptomyces albireticuli TaxID=1940 RepID=A0A2A2D236_9ACTN|nr:ribonuclease domain-containing protein [Streptomyces albireticuli]MCD9140719.1 ribonuclease [Streptomyces albireticuli]MCD9161319.1 ribonuclease [Streptomyces albireticuli]MCD9190623.1 ribonuclease [Streptomyces albireticuli]PAU46493.1 ribonuclease [Streptomyces albireticuli]